MTPLLLIAALHAAAPGKTPEPTLEAVLADGKKTGKPLFLDVFTTWCLPCKKLDREVFPAPEMQTAMKPYRFQHLDGEGASADALRERFQVVAFPTLLVLTPDGAEVARLEAQDAAGLSRALRELLPLARTRAPGPPAGLAYLAAKEALRRGDPGAADAHFEEAERADPKDENHIASRAAWERLRRAGPEVGKPQRAERLLTFARTYPGAAQTDSALEGIAFLKLKGTALPADFASVLGVVADAHAKSGDTGGLGRLIDVSLATGDTSRAVKLGERMASLKPRPAESDRYAEALFQAGKREQAIEVEEGAVKRDPSLQTRLLHLRKDAPGIRPADFRFADAFGPSAAEKLVSEVSQHGEAMGAVAAAKTTLLAACGDRFPAGAPKIAVAMGFKRGKLLSVSASGPGVTPELQRCLSTAGKQILPGDETLNGTYTLHLARP